MPRQSAAHRVAGPRKKGRATVAKTRKASKRGLVPNIQNITDIGSTLDAGTLLHFTAKQWEQMTADIPIGKGVPKFGVALEYYPIPGGDVVAQPICVQNPCEICRVRPTSFGPDGFIGFECLCKPDPNCPQDPPPPPPSPLCRIGIQQVRGMFRLACISQGCARTCRLSAVRDGNRYVIVCRCS